MTECNQWSCHTRAVPVNAPDSVAAERLSGDERRAALLDVTKQILDEHGPAGVTMGTVAERADVTRALVYKHFENRDALIAELYLREAAALDRTIRERVGVAPDGFEPKLRAFVGACLDAVGEHSRFFAPLRSAEASPSRRRQQRRWDRRTSGYFVELAMEEFGIDERAATSAIGVLFMGIQALLSEMRRSPGQAQRDHLETTYVEMTIGALARLATVPPHAGSDDVA